MGHFPLLREVRRCELLIAHLLLVQSNLEEKENKKNECVLLRFCEQVEITFILYGLIKSNMYEKKDKTRNHGILLYRRRQKTGSLIGTPFPGDSRPFSG